MVSLAVFECFEVGRWHVVVLDFPAILGCLSVTLLSCWCERRFLLPRSVYLLDMDRVLSTYLDSFTSLLPR